jgi:hypothetical protein
VSNTLRHATSEISVDLYGRLTKEASQAAADSLGCPGCRRGAGERAAGALRPHCDQGPRLTSGSVGDEPLVRSRAASGNRTPDLPIASVSRHYRHLDEFAGSGTSTVRTRPGTSTQTLSRFPLSLSLMLFPRGTDIPGAGSDQSRRSQSSPPPVHSHPPGVFIPAATPPGERSNLRHTVYKWFVNSRRCLPSDVLFCLDRRRSYS